MLGLSDVEQIASALKKYGIKDDANTRAQIRLVWSVWPVAANEYGSYTVSSRDKTLSKNAVAFRAKIAELSKVPANRVTLISAAIVDAYMAGNLAQKTFDPQNYKAAAAAKSEMTSEIVAAGGGSFMDKLVAAGTGLKKTWTWVKWGGLGIGLIVILVLLKPYATVGLSFLKRKQGRKDGD